MDKILITGGSGYLGQGLTKRLIRDGIEPVVANTKNCDLRLSSSLSQFDDIKFDKIFHLATWTQAGDFCLYHSGEQWIINQKINTNVLDWWQRKQPSAKLVFMGTSCAYATDLPLKEENYMKGIPIESLFTYAMTKRMLHAGALALNKQYGLNYLCIVPSTLYGPDYHTDGRQMHFIFDLIRKIIRAKYLGEKVILWGDGNQSRELVLLSDFVDTMLKLVESINNDLINIGAGEEYTIKYFAELICKIVDYDFDKIEFDGNRYVGAKSKCLDVEKLDSIIPDRKKTPLEEGLKDTVGYFLDHKDVVIAL